MIVLIWIAAFIFALMVIIAGRIAGYYEYLSILAESAMLTEAAAEVADKTAEVETPKKEPQAVKTAEVETSKKEPQAVKTAQTVDRGHHQAIYLNDDKSHSPSIEKLPRSREAGKPITGKSPDTSLSAVNFSAAIAKWQSANTTATTDTGRQDSKELFAKTVTETSGETQQSTTDYDEGNSREDIEEILELERRIEKNVKSERDERIAARRAKRAKNGGTPRPGDVEFRIVPPR